MTEFYLGLGSNLGDRMALLRAAVEALCARPGVVLERVSKVYETAPVGGVPQGDYLNLVVGGATTLSPEELLSVCLAIEKSLGRVRLERWGPRTIDIDVLWFGGQTVSTGTLELPHPRLEERAFVMIPLAEIAPGLPLTGGQANEVASRLSGQGIQSTDETLSLKPTGRVHFKEVPWLGGVEPVFAAWRHRRGAVWLDSALEAGGLGRYSLIGCDPELEIVGQEEGAWLRHGERDRFETGSPWEIVARFHQSRSRSGLTSLPFRGGLIGYATYESGLSFEGIEPRAPSEGAPLMRWGSYERLLVEDKRHKRLFVVADSRHPEEAESLLAEMLEDLERVRRHPIPVDDAEPFSAGVISTSFTEADYNVSISKIRDYIASGDVYQVNLARRYRAEIGAGAGWALHQRLRALNPAPYSAYLKFEDEEIVSSSPERFLSVRHGHVSTRPIKGTRPRGRNTEEDQAQREALLSSEKDRAELLMIVDLERNDLGRVCETGSVVVSELYTLETYPTVHHLVAEVKGTLKPEKNLFDLLRATFPGGSITGAPKVRAMQLIDELEPVRRGVYTGAIGFLGYDGNAELNIAIRTLQCRDGFVSFHAGSGVVWDSEASSEFAEVHAKARALLRAVTGVSHAEALL